MQEKHPKIYSQKINTLKSKVQNEYYYHARKDIDNNEDDILRETEISRSDLIRKINNIFSRTNFIYQADITIMYKNGENKNKKIIGFKDNYLLTSDGLKISIDDIYDIK